MSGWNLSQTESYVLRYVSLLDGELAMLDWHRQEISQLEAQIWSARSDSSAGTPAYGAAGGLYGAKAVAAAAYVPPSSQGLEARLEEIRLAESGIAARISQLVRSLQGHGSEIQRIRNEVNQDLARLSSRHDQLHGEDPKAFYSEAENRYRHNLHKCEETLHRIDDALHRAGAAMSSGSPPSLVGGAVTTRTRGLDDYICDGLRDETLYAMARKRDEQIDSPPEPPSAHLGDFREQRSGTLAQKIGAGQGYGKIPVADEYKIPLTRYYYELYRRDCHSPDTQGRYLVME